jgi:hypothetical protein
MCRYNFDREKLPLLGPIPLDLTPDWRSMVFCLTPLSSRMSPGHATDALTRVSISALVVPACMHTRTRFMPIDRTHVETLNEREERARVSGIKNSTVGVGGCTIDGGWRFAKWPRTCAV